MTTMIKSQKKTIGPRKIKYYDKPAVMSVQLRHDDECGNGHNTFAITAEIASREGGRIESCGCLHDEIRKHFPELAYLIKWHLCSTDGPMHYIAGTVYHALQHGPKSAWISYVDQSHPLKPKGMKYCGVVEANDIAAKYPGCVIQIDEKTAKVANFGYARSSAIWPEATDEQLASPDLPQMLADRLPGLLAEFQQVIVGLGFTF